MTRDVVLLNGWGMTRAAWEPVCGAMPRDFVFHPLDLDAGFAEHYGTHAALASAVARVAPARCSVVAWSLGAQVALQWAHDAPQQVKRLVLIAATPAFVARADWSAAMPSETFEAFASRVDHDAAAAITRFAALQARGEADVTSVAWRLRGALAESGPALRAGLDLLRAGDLRGVLDGLRQPVHLVHGANDALIPVEAAERLQRALPDARLTVLRAAGHAPHVSHPATVAGVIADFFHGE